MARGIAGEENASGYRFAQSVRDPVALISDRVPAKAVGQLQCRLLDVEARIERAHANAHFVISGEAPPVPGRHDRSLDPYLQVLARAVWMHFEAARERCVRWLIAVRVE